MIIRLHKTKTKQQSYNENENIYFLSKHELFQLLSQDTDNFYKTFKQIDLKARNIHNIDEYIQNRITKSVSEFSLNERKLIQKYIPIIMNKLSSLNENWFCFDKALKIKWKIGCIENIFYEEGFPHTRNDVILLNRTIFNDDKLIESNLMHEFIHIYQKIYPDDAQIYINENGFTPVMKRMKCDNCRVNPDINEWIYKKDGIIYQAIFNNDNPRNISDVSIPYNLNSFEHPYEEMAYKIIDMFK